MTEPESDPASIVIANEFAEVVVRRVNTPNGMRLEVRSARRATWVHLDALVLEALTWQPPELLSQLLADRPAP